MPLLQCPVQQILGLGGDPRVCARLRPHNPFKEVRSWSQFLLLLLVVVFLVFLALLLLLLSKGGFRPGCELAGDDLRHPRRPPAAVERPVLRQKQLAYLCVFGVFRF